MGGGKNAPDPPDYSELAASSKEAAEISAGVSMEQLEWAKEQFGVNQQLLQDVLGIQMPIAIEQWENSVADRERYEDVFQPVEDQLVQEFQDYGSEQRKEMEAGRAMSDVARTGDAQREQALQRLEGYGIDPSQTRSAALDANLRAQEAAQMAGAGNQARERVDNIGRALRSEAINIGKGLPSQVAASYGQSIAAPQYAMQGANQTFQAGSQAMGNPNAWMNTAQQGYAGTGNLMNQGYGNQMSQYNANEAASNAFSGGLGQIAGIAGAAMIAEGGPIDAEGFATTGIPIEGGGELIRGPGGPKGDAIDAKLSDGEYIIPEDVMRRKGTEFFDKLVEKTQGELEEKRANDPKYINQRQPTQMTPQGPMAYADGGPMAIPGYQEGGNVAPATNPPQLPTGQAGAGQAGVGQPPAGSFVGRESWRQAIPTSVPVTPIPSSNQQIPQGPTPEQQQMAGDARSNWEAMRARYAQPTGGGATGGGATEGAITRNEGEGFMDYFRRKYGIGEAGAAPTQEGAVQGLVGKIADTAYNQMNPWDDPSGTNYIGPGGGGGGE